MNSSAAKKLPLSPAQESQEFTVYSFENPDRRLRSRWHRHDSTPDGERAVALARTLYDSGRYHRIEVKRKVFDRRINRHVDTTFRTYENRRRLRFGFTAIVAFAALCGGIAFAACSLMG